MEGEAQHTETIGGKDTSDECGVILWVNVHTRMLPIATSDELTSDTGADDDFPHFRV